VLTEQNVREDMSNNEAIFVKYLALSVLASEFEPFSFIIQFRLSAPELMRTFPE
jgi:hypothetical protein